MLIHYTPYATSVPHFFLPWLRFIPLTSILAGAPDTVLHLPRDLEKLTHSDHAVHHDESAVTLPVTDRSHRSTDPFGRILTSQDSIGAFPASGLIPAALTCDAIRFDQFGSLNESLDRVNQPTILPPVDRLQ
ncbi:MAG: hypothetical protein WBA87_07940 [Microbacterium sp.]